MMHVLLTGASGFVGSHILDSLRVRGIATAVLLRGTSDKQFLQHHLSQIEVRTGSILEPESLRYALKGITHVIHCAGCTRARRHSEFYDINHHGTRNLVDAVNSQSGGIRQFVHISSLAVTGPATPANPAREGDAPRPISEYGKSKLAGELEVRHQCRVPYTILRPPAVYGPRDRGFFTLFQAVKSHVLPLTSKSQALSLVYVKDLAEAVATCLDHGPALGKTFFVAGSQVVTGRAMAEEIARQMKQWTVPCPLPTYAFWPVCVFGELSAHLTGKANLLNLQKFAELRAPGWVCDPSLLKREIGFSCGTGLQDGVKETLAWYQQEKWI